jgi:hypothetical protein
VQSLVREAELGRLGVGGKREGAGQGDQRKKRGCGKKRRLGRLEERKAELGILKEKRFVVADWKDRFYREDKLKWRFEDYLHCD